MNKHRKLLSLTMMTALAVFTLAGCGANNSNTTTGSPATSSSGESSASSENTKTAEETTLTIGRITSIEGNRITLERYTSKEKIFAATDIDTDALSATGETATVTLSDEARVETVTNGVIETSTTDSLAVDDLIAVSDEKGQTIYVLGAVADGTGTNATGSSETVSDTASTSSADVTSTGSSDGTSNENTSNASTSPDSSTASGETTTNTTPDDSTTNESGAVTYPETTTDSTNENTATVQ